MHDKKICRLVAKDVRLEKACRTQRHKFVDTFANRVKEPKALFGVQAGPGITTSSYFTTFPTSQVSFRSLNGAGVSINFKT